MAIKSLAQTLKDLATGIKNTVTDITSSNATLTITKGDGTTSAVTVNNVANADAAMKATQDSEGQQINTTYIKELSISEQTITYMKGNGGTGTITLPTNAGIKGYITESVVNSDGSWYRKYSDGWLEQGGVMSGLTVASSNAHYKKTVTLLKPYADTNYVVSFGYFMESNGNVYSTHFPSSLSTTNFVYEYGNSGLSTQNWYACGMGVE